MPAFYHRPATIMDLVHQTLGKALDQVGIEHALFKRWAGRETANQGQTTIQIGDKRAA
jgi:4-hydroxy-3-polyprenylbenzoate decarboxylase